MNKAIKSLIPLFIQKLWIHLSSRRKKQFFVLLVLIILSAFAEIISLGAVLPFLAVITAPETIFGEPYIQPLTSFLGIETPEQIILPITFIFISASLLAAFMRIFVLWFSTKLSYGTGADISVEAYRKTLYQPYTVHVSRNSSEVVSSIMTKINSATGTLNLTLAFIASTIIAVAIIVALLSIDPFIAISSSIFFGICYFIISLFTRPKLQVNSKSINLSTSGSQKILQEGLGGVRDILLDGTQKIYIDKFNQQQRIMRSSQGQNFFLGGSPRFAMESLGMILIALLSLLLLSGSNEANEFIPILGAMALGAQRLIPAMQQIYIGWTGIAGHKESVIAFIDLLDQSTDETQYKVSHSPLPLIKEIKFDSLYFKYKDDEKWLIEDFNLTIPRGKKIGIAGYTGSGKSTLIDILMGLLIPSRGSILIDGAKIENQRIFEWQKSISHVPQSIFLADMTIAENIAFGVDRELISIDKIDKVVRYAQLEEFINKCPDKYNTLVGEQGIRLSGGQRQRIGIARALYKKSEVLILDEATSALDNLTEIKIMDSIEELSNDLTVFIIAHRISTIKNCDTIVVLDDGKLSAQGSYEDLVNNCDVFKRLVSEVDN